VKNRGKVWSQQQGDVNSNEVSTSVDVTCAPTCPPSSTTSSVSWTKLLDNQHGNNPKCSDFGMTSLFKKEGGLGQTWYTDRTAAMLIVKDGTCGSGSGKYYAKKVLPNDPSKWIASGLKVQFYCDEDDKYKDLSHVEFCGCPTGASALFNAWSDVSGDPR